MLIYAMLAAGLTIAAVIYKRSRDDEIFNSVIFMVFYMMVVVGFIGGVMGFENTYTEVTYKSPLYKIDGEYLHIVPRGGHHTFLYKDKTGVHILNRADADLRTYGTNKNPWAEKHCFHTKEWVLPFGWDFGTHTTCDINFHIPLGVTAD